jgi:PAS domain S-box-containing protein
MDVVSNHAFALIKRGGSWQVIGSAERKRIEASLRHTEQRYSRLFEQITEGFALHEIICDDQGVPCDYRFLELNPAFERLTGLKRDDVAGKTLRQVLPNEDPKWVSIYGAVALTGEPVRFENYAPTLQRYYDVLAYQPSPGQFATVFTDITERKRADENVREATATAERHLAQLEAIFGSLNEGLVVADMNGYPFRWNPAAIAMHGFSSPDECRQSLPELARTFVLSDPEGNVLPLDRWPLARILRGENLRNLEVHIRRIDRDWSRVFHYGGCLVRDPKGQQFLAVVTVNDVTEQKRAEAALREATERKRVEEELRTASRYARSLLEASLDPLVTISPDGRITDVNQATELVTGVARDRLIGSSFSAYVTEPAKADAGYQRVLSEGMVRDYPLTIRHVSGSATDVLYNATVYRNEAGQVQGVFAAARDVTERNRMEERLRGANESLQRLAAIVECAEAGIVGKTLDGIITSWNKGAETVYGYTAAEAIGKPVSMLAPPERHEEIPAILERIRRGERVDHFETLRVTRNGRRMAVSLTISPIKDAQGAIIGASAIARDITERKRIEEQLRVASLYARSLIEASLDPLVTISPEGRITDVNRATESVTGVPRQLLIGTSFSAYFTEPQKAEVGYHRVLAEGMVRDYPLTIRHTSGSTTDVLYNATVYRNEAGQVQGVFAAARDVTQRKRAEAELARYRDHLEDLVRQRTETLERTSAELERSNRELEQFAYVASHDLQEPLRAVTGYLGLLEQRAGEQLDERSRHWIAGAVQGASRMHTLITDLLALSRVGTSGQAFAPADLNAALDRALDALQAAVDETGAVVTHDPLPTVPVDGCQVVQLFQNLVGNAIKFRGEQPPKIHIGARREPAQWVVSVRDNGIGIEPKYFARVFLVFQRLHTRRRYPGTGMGLAICKKIVERHGGAIWVDSKPGEGSTFSFTIPDSQELL